MCINTNMLNNQKFAEYFSNSYDITPNSKIKLKDIFNDHWDDFILYANEHNLQIRDVVFAEVDRIISCGCMSEGYFAYICENCQEVKYLFLIN